MTYEAKQYRSESDICAEATQLALAHSVALHVQARTYAAFAAQLEDEVNAIRNGRNLGYLFRLLHGLADCGAEPALLRYIASVGLTHDGFCQKVFCRVAESPRPFVRPRRPARRGDN